ncbi:MAG: type I 3-dehydroquinate dehydratase [Candidatus Freyarchaeota archaeon]|nr:type I 3-dehydroquinate dehydratase [Candidatus Freyrarchaeum guaymaensis]
MLRSKGRVSLAGAGLFRVCVSVRADSEEGMLEKARRACDAGADLVELRLDYLKRRRVRVGRLLSDIGVPVIVTVRRRGEGGVFPFSEGERVKLIEKCVLSGPDFVDVEASTDPALLGRLVSLCKEVGVTLILSYHDFEATPTWSFLARKVDILFSLGCDVAKIVTLARRITDNLLLLKLASTKRRGRTVSFCMGRLGAVSRILCPLFGSPFTYASLDDPVAPGQISVDVMRRIQEEIGSLLNDAARPP